MAKKSETINIAEAKARLSALVERAAGGEEIIVARNGKPKAKLVRWRRKRPTSMELGKANGKV